MNVMAGGVNAAAARISVVAGIVPNAC